jgi:hypothetical protein
MHDSAGMTKGSLIGVVAAVASFASLLFACAGSDGVDSPAPAPDVSELSLEGRGSRCQGSSSGFSGPTSCEAQQVYTCGKKTQSITCECTNGTSPGTCTCGDLTTFPFDCSNMCTITSTQLSACGIK